jgi:ABC-2 type transport system ATP-binding protein
MIVLELEEVCKSFRSGLLGARRRILSGLTLSLEQGEVFGFLGHNGAGKTTTIKLILGFLRPDSGRISILGSTGAVRRTRERIGYLGENVGLYPFLDAEETLRFMGKLFRMDRRTIESRSRRLLELVGMADRSKLKVKKYSKGMRQRLGIAVALFNDPDLLLLDEPYSGLDPLGRRQLKDILLGLKKEGKTILLSSHIAPDVEAICDRVGILKNGKIARFLDLTDLYRAGSGEVEVSASGVSADMLASAVAGVEVVHSHGETAILRCRGEEILKGLIASIYSSGGTLQEVRRFKPTLEEFLVATLEEREEKTSGEATGDSAEAERKEPSFSMPR